MFWNFYILWNFKLSDVKKLLRYEILMLSDAAFSDVYIVLSPTHSPTPIHCLLADYSIPHSDRFVNFLRRMCL
jgi:hypothetical protein